MSSLYRLEINQPGQTSDTATLVKLIFCGNVFNNSIYYILNNTCKHHGLCFVHVWSSHSMCHEWDPCLYLYSLISEIVSRYLYFPVLHSVRSRLTDVIVCHKVVFSKVLIPMFVLHKAVPFARRLLYIFPVFPEEDLCSFMLR